MKRNNFLKCASWTNAIQSSLMQEILEKSSCKDITSFALGFPDPVLFPIDEYKKSIENVIQAGQHVFQYAPPLLSLKQKIAELMFARGVNCQEDQIFLTGGAQQAVYLLSKLLLEENSVLSTGTQTYPAFLQIIAPFKPEILGIPISIHSGLCLDSLEKVLNRKARKPNFFYIVPTGHNPLGITLTEAQKEKIAFLSRYYKVPVIEDDCYGFLNYEGTTKSIRAYEDEWVFYVGSFSKILSPAFRVGWIVVPKKIIPKLSFIKEATDINTISFSQRIVDDLLRRKILIKHLILLRTLYKEKRDAMLQAIKKYFPANTKVSEPKDGFFIWVELAERLNTTSLLKKAIEQNIVFVSSEDFACNIEYKIYNAIRLNFSYCSTLIIEKGIKKLGNIISEEICSLKNSTEKNVSSIHN